MKTYILAPGSYGEVVADNISIPKNERVYTSREGEILGQDGNSLIAQKVASDKEGALGIIPVHNLYGQAVGNAVAAIIKQGDAVTIVGDYLLPISHVLAMKTGGQVPENIYSHEQALRQCSDALNRRYSSSQLHRVNATSEKIDNLGERDAVVCARETAIQGNLVIVDDGINPPHNETLFVIIATTAKLSALLSEIPKTPNNTSLVNITLPDKRGAFVELINALNQGAEGGHADLRGFSQVNSCVKTGGTIHDIHLVYRSLNEEKVENREGIQFVPKLQFKK